MGRRVRGQRADRQARGCPLPTEKRRSSRGRQNLPGKIRQGQTGARVIVEKTYNEGDESFKNQLSTIAAAKPDVVFVPGSYADAGVIVRRARPASNVL